MTSRDRSRGAGPLLLLASLLLLLAIGEIAARLWTSMRSPGSEPQTTTAEVEGLPVLKGLRAIDRPNVHGVHNGVAFRTNDRGVRGPDFAPLPAPGAFRILIGGDSVVMGSGVEEAAVYATELSRRLEDPRRPIEVINGGLAGLNAVDVAGRLERLAQDYAPDLLVYGFTINDIEGPDYEAFDDEAVRALWQRAGRHAESPSALLRVLWPRFVMTRERLFPTLPSEDREIDYNYFENQAAWSTFETALDRIAAIARQREICAHLFVHTHLKALDDEHPYLRVYERVAEAARSRGFSVTQSWPAFAGRAPDPLWVGFLDPHPNADGHALLADALAAGLEALPERCWAR